MHFGRPRFSATSAKYQHHFMNCQNPPKHQKSSTQLVAVTQSPNLYSSPNLQELIDAANHKRDRIFVVGTISAMIYLLDV